MRRGAVPEPRGISSKAQGAAVGRLDRRRVASRGARVRGLGQLGDVVEIDVVVGAVGGGSHYGLQTLW
jgi:hypothetical protein